MKFVLVPILSLLVLIQTFSQWLVIAEYNLNKEYISKNLCINKAKPKLRCHGKCQMMKKLAEEETQNTPVPSSAGKIKTPEVNFFEEFPEISITPVKAIKTVYVKYQFPKYPSPVVSIFHPPSIS